MTVHLRSCNRCGGDMNSNRDIYGEYRLCMRCGNIIDVPKGSDLFSLQSGADNTDRKKAA